MFSDIQCVIHVSACKKQLCSLKASTDALLYRVFLIYQPRTEHFFLRPNFVKSKFLKTNFLFFSSSRILLINIVVTWLFKLTTLNSVQSTNFEINVWQYYKYWCFSGHKIFILCSILRVTIVILSDSSNLSNIYILILFNL